MKKKNLLWGLLSVMLVALMGVSVSACSSDDDETITWIGTDGNDKLTLVWESDGTGTWTFVDMSSSGQVKGTYTGTFTWKEVSKNMGMLYVIGADNSFSFSHGSYSYSGGGQVATLYYVIAGNTLSLYEDGFGEDLEYVLIKES